MSKNKKVEEKNVNRSADNGFNSDGATVPEPTKKATSLPKVTSAIPEELSSRFFECPVVTPDGTHQSVLVAPAGHMLQKGVYPDNLRAAQLLLLISISSRLGYPLSAMIVAEDKLDVVGLLDAVAKLTPEKAVREVGSVALDLLFAQGGLHYRDRCIVCPNPDGFSKVQAHIESLLSSDHATHQELVKRRFDTGMEVCTAQGPISFIGVENGKKSGKGLSHPSILKVPVLRQTFLPESLQTSVLEHMDLAKSPDFKIRKTFERLKAVPVEIPFAEVLWQAIAESQCEHPFIKMSVLIKLISICAIINQPPPLTNAELGSYFYGISEVEVRRALVGLGDDQQRQEDVTGRGAINATKIDYYLAKGLLEGLLSTGGPYLNERQKQVFQSVKEINIGKINQAIIKDGDDVKKLATINRSTNCWTPREAVYERINNAGSETYALSSVSNDLVALHEMGLLDRAKPPKSRAYGYYINKMDIDGAIRLPEPAEIQDPIYQGQEVSVVNPITGQIEKI
ncbi:MAG: hypothetical protein HF981_00800 [Desulfobacteraceae bacterium]|nr:hypothetical protein [Desulfobacteraceae bacterium]MBC2748907.1 hypothetical protein [Desulfobacteraceae bacterium]